MTGIAGNNTAELTTLQAKEESSSTKETINESVKEALRAYLVDLDGHKISNLYQMVISEVERPLLETVLRHTRGNQTQAAEILGINRGTLRKKLRLHGLD